MSGTSRIILHCAATKAHVPACRYPLVEQGAEVNVDALGGDLVATRNGYLPPL
jgi:hypothetical protein